MRCGVLARVLDQMVQVAPSCAMCLLCLLVATPGFMLIKQLSCFLKLKHGVSVPSLPLKHDKMATNDGNYHGIEMSLR